MASNDCIYLFNKGRRGVCARLGHEFPHSQEPILQLVALCLRGALICVNCSLNSPKCNPATKKVDKKKETPPD